MLKDLKLCAWGAPAGMVLLGLALLPAAQFIPPPSPALDAAGIAAFYRDHSYGIRIGAILLMAGAACLVAFFVAISAALLRIRPVPVALAGVQLALGALALTPLLLSALIFAAAAFRAERSDEGIQLLSDLGWLFLIMPAPPALLQLAAIGFAILGDTSPKPVFPRWIAYLNFWVAILFQPGALVPLFKHGPFAWDGLLAFWMPLGVLGIWVVVMFVALLRLDEESPSVRP